jgi:hypothetical protein
LNAGFFVYFLEKLQEEEEEASLGTIVEYKDGIQQKMANSVLIKLNQTGPSRKLLMRASCQRGSDTDQ